MTAAQTESILVDAKAAATMLGICRSSWLTHLIAGKTPEPVRIGRRVLWNRAELVRWVEAKCPSREKWAALNAPTAKTGK